MATDIVGGLRILRGIGGEETFGGNYAGQSQRVRQSGVAAGRWLAAVESVGVLLSGGFVVALMWLGTREVVQGRLTVGQFVSFPRLRPLPHPADAHLRRVRPEVDPLGRLGAQGGRRLLAEPAVGPPRRAGHARPRRRDRRRRVRASIRPGILTMVVCAPTTRPPSPTVSAATCPARRALVSDEIPEGLKGRAARRERSARARARDEQARRDEERARRPWGVTVGGVDLSPRRGLEDVRRHILVSDTAPQVFAGTLRSAVDPLGRLSREQAERALYTAAADDARRAARRLAGRAGGAWPRPVRWPTPAARAHARPRRRPGRARPRRAHLRRRRPHRGPDRRPPRRAPRRTHDRRADRLTAPAAPRDEVILLESGVATARDGTPTCSRTRRHTAPSSSAAATPTRPPSRTCPRSPDDPARRHGRHGRHGTHHRRHARLGLAAARRAAGRRVGPHVGRGHPGAGRPRPAAPADVGGGARQRPAPPAPAARAPRAGVRRRHDERPHRPADGRQPRASSASSAGSCRSNASSWWPSSSPTPSPRPPGCSSRGCSASSTPPSPTSRPGAPTPPWPGPTRRRSSWPGWSSSRARSPSPRSSPRRCSARASSPPRASSSSARSCGCRCRGSRAPAPPATSSPASPATSAR